MVAKPEDKARSSGRLRRATVDDLTIRRVRVGRNFGYRDADGGRITD
jgi:DNA topoisomerase-1